MRLDRVTITGADNSTNPVDLFNLSEKYPFVEWGILASAGSGGQPRYPGMGWVQALQMQVRNFYRLPQEQPRMCLHLCGRWVRDLLVGNVSVPSWMFDEFDRVQLNFHAERNHCQPVDFRSALEGIGGERQYIFQLDGVLGNKHMMSLLAVNNAAKPLDLAPLYDISGGAGILPPSWPKPIPNLYMGYAGGLGPDNLEEQIPKIAEAAGDARFWIDMETRVRSANDRIFDLKKVERCLEIAAGYIAK